LAIYDRNYGLNIFNIQKWRTNDFMRSSCMEDRRNEETEILKMKTLLRKVK